MSLQTQHDPKNETEITYWNSAGGGRWVARQNLGDIVLAPIAGRYALVVNNGQSFPASRCEGEPLGDVIE